MSAQNDFPSFRQVAHSFVDAAMHIAHPRYLLAFLIAYLAWKYTPPGIAFVVGLITLALLAVDEYREVRRG